jgi:putative transposase
MKGLYLLLGISKQSHAQAVERSERELEKAPCYVGLMETVREMHPSMGLRAMYEQFQPEGIGRDGFIALGLREGFRVRAVESPMKTTVSVRSARWGNLLADLRLTGVNQVWVSDIFYFPLEGRHFYVVLIMDVYSRRIVGCSVADNMRAENNLAALRAAIHLRGVDDYGGRLVHHSDRGAQYTSDDYTGLLKSFGIRISMCADVLENAHCERANGTIKNYYLTAWNPKSQKELFQLVPRAVENYNNRNHTGLNPTMTPLQFETYVKELPTKNRPHMTIFTMKRNVENPGQLSLF